MLGSRARRTDAELGMPVHVLIRCRPGGFIYSPEEIGWMAQEAGDAVRAGAAGVVVGALTPDGRIDNLSLARISAAAREADAGTQLTFHRAMDQLQDPASHLDDLAASGIARVLTSGGAPTVVQGLPTIAAMLARGTGIEIMAGGGILPEHLRRIIAVGVHAVHLSAKRPLRQAFRNRVSVGSVMPSVDGGQNDIHYETDEALVRDVVRVVRG